MRTATLERPTLIDRIYPRYGLEAGDLEPASFEAALALVGPALTRPDGLVLHGRIQWPKVLDGFFPASDITYVAGWEIRGNPVMVADLAAILWHHTAGKPTAKKPNPSLGICTNGRPAGRGVSAVPGPLVHFLVGYDGHIWVICSGRANHAGTGHVALLDRMRAGLLPSGTAKALGLRDTGGSGGNLIGVELENDGKSPLTPAQLITAARLARACYRLGLGKVRAVGWDHEAWTSRKVDLIATEHSRLISAYENWKSIT